MKQLLSFTLSILISTLVLAQPSGFTKVTSTDALKAQMQEVGVNQKTIKSNFNQVKKMEYLDIAIQSSGKFRYSAPSKVRWEYTNPYNYTIIINNGKLSLISDKNENSFDMDNSDVFEQINKLMIGSVTGEILENPDYSVNVFENTNEYLIQLQPKSEGMAEYIQKMELLFDKQRAVVLSIKMYETEDNYSEISFSNIKVNEPIPEKVFLP